MTGRLIAIEGIDGSGKGTQAARLVERFRASGRSVRLLSFPRYGETFFARRVGDFLNGRFGPLDRLPPLFTAMLFAGDRFESRRLLLDALNECDYVVCDRYVASNIAHQASRAGGQSAELMRHIEELEFDVYQLPRPHRTLWFDVSPNRARQLVEKKAARSYTEEKLDLQEADLAYQTQVAAAYAKLANASDWRRIPVEDAAGLRSEAAIHDDAWAAVQE